MKVRKLLEEPRSLNVVMFCVITKQQFSALFFHYTDEEQLCTAVGNHFYVILKTR